MQFKDYYKQVQDNRQSIIDYYVNQFGSETRQMFEERFDRIKFCFYVDPNCIDNYIESQCYEQYLSETVNFVKDTLRQSVEDTDTSDIHLEGGFIKCNDKIKAVLKNFFGPTKSLGQFYGKPVFYEGIWAFLEDVSGTTATMQLQWDNNYAKKMGKREISLEEFTLVRKCEFLKEMGCFPQEMNDENIAKSEEFERLNKKYSSLASLAWEYKKRAEEPFRQLAEYAIAQKAREAELGNDKMAIAQSRIIGGNFAPEDEQDVEGMFHEGVHATWVVQENGEIKKVVIFFNPFITERHTADIDFRHEIRHAMTASASVSNGIATIKIGNKLFVQQGNTSLGTQLEQFNEFVTQRDAIEETEDAFSRGIYLICDDGTTLEGGAPAKYDAYLPFGNLVISTEPLLSAVWQSQIADSNEGLYGVISLEQLQRLESIMTAEYTRSSENIRELKKLMEELGIEEVDVKLKEVFGFKSQER